MMGPKGQPGQGLAQTLSGRQSLPLLTAAVLSCTPRYEVDEENTLRIHYVTTLDSGRYICTAQNQVGTISAQASLTVQGKQLHAAFTARQDWSMRTGSSETVVPRTPCFLRAPGTGGGRKLSPATGHT